MSPALVLFDDQIARDWIPFALTRPAGELRFGALTLRERAERVFALPCIGHLGAAHLRGFEEPDARPVVELGTLPRDRDLLFLSSRAVPDWATIPLDTAEEPMLLRIADTLCGWYAPAGSPFPPAEFFLDPVRNHPPAARVAERGGTLLERPWHLVTQNAAQLTVDIGALFPAPPRTASPPGVHLLGDAPLILSPGSEIEPGVVIDLRHGPVWLDEGARLTAFTRLAGPAYVGKGSTILGGAVGEVSIGPVCRIHGEVETAVVLGYSNKAHDGFLGHAYLGCWVNLGAMTTNSDLKNNYGNVRLQTPNGEVDTGERKLGCLLGDHVKTAIGTLLNTGTVVGAGSNLFGAAQPAKYVPPFSWGADGTYALEKFLATAEVVMGRRGVALGAGQRTLLEAAWALERDRT